jgi:hypothetical protein
LLFLYYHHTVVVGVLILYILILSHWILDLTV